MNSALGNVASEMAGQSVLQTNSPANKVTAALTSANKSKAVSERLYIWSSVADSRVSSQEDCTTLSDSQVSLISNYLISHDCKCRTRS